MLNRGFSLVELMITVAVLGIVLMIALPNMGAWLQNTQIRTSAEAMQAGLQLARAEALKRNTTVRFQLVDTLTSACTLSPQGPNWVVSIGDTTGLCEQDASDTAAPQLVQKRAAAEGSPNALVQEVVRAFYHGWYRELVTDLPPMAKGFIAAPEAPGLGIALKPGLRDRPDATLRASVL